MDGEVEVRDERSVSFEKSQGGFTIRIEDSILKCECRGRWTFQEEDEVYQ